MFTNIDKKRIIFLYVLGSAIDASQVNAIRGEVTSMKREGMGYSSDHFRLVERPSFL